MILGSPSPSTRWSLFLWNRFLLLCVPELCSSLLPPLSMRLLGKFNFLEIIVVALWPEERGQVSFLRIFLSSAKTFGRSQPLHHELFFLPNQSLDGASLCTSSCSLNKCFLFFFTHFCTHTFIWGSLFVALTFLPCFLWPTWPVDPAQLWGSSGTNLLSLKLLGSFGVSSL